MDMDTSRNYFPLAGRAIIPANTPTSSPKILTFEPQANTLEYIILNLPTANIAQEVGVRVRTGDGVIYPAMGSVSDSNFGGLDSFGLAPTSGQSLTLPFSQRIPGSPNRVYVEFYNAAGSQVLVNIILVASQAKQIRVQVIEKQKEQIEP